MKRYTPVIATGPMNATTGMIEAIDGRYCHFSEAQARIEALEAALRATIAYMKDDSGGYEVYRATLDSAEAALEKQP